MVHVGGDLFRQVDHGARGNASNRGIDLDRRYVSREIASPCEADVETEGWLWNGFWKTGGAVDGRQRESPKRMPAAPPWQGSPGSRA